MSASIESNKLKTREVLLDTFEDWTNEVLNIKQEFDMGEMYPDVDWYERFCQRVKDQPIKGPLERYHGKDDEFSPGVLSPENFVVQELETIAKELNSLPPEARVRQLVRNAYELLYPNRDFEKRWNSKFFPGTISYNDYKEATKV